MYVSGVEGAEGEDHVLLRVHTDEGQCAHRFFMPYEQRCGVEAQTKKRDTSTNNHVYFFFCLQFMQQ